MDSGRVVFTRVMPARLEISDLVWPLDAEGRPDHVVRSATVDTLRERGQHEAARVVAGMPHRGDVIDPPAVAASNVARCTSSGTEAAFPTATIPVRAPSVRAGRSVAAGRPPGVAR